MFDRLRWWAVELHAQRLCDRAQQRTLDLDVTRCELFAGRPDPAVATNRRVRRQARNKRPQSPAADVLKLRAQVQAVVALKVGLEEPPARG